MEDLMNAVLYASNRLYELVCLIRYNSLFPLNKPAPPDCDSRLSKHVCNITLLLIYFGCEQESIKKQ